MTDRHDGFDMDADDEQEEGRPRPSTEGVRILGAEEARAALDRGEVARRLGEDETRYGDVPPRPDPAMRPAVRFPLPGGTESLLQRAGSDEPGGEVRDEGVIPAGEPPPARVEPPPARVEPPPARVEPPPARVEPPARDITAPVVLPHWTEPPTGEVPQILPEAEPVDLAAEEDLDVWATTSGQAPRFRSGAGDWAEADFAEMDSLKEDDLALGALADVSDDDDHEFEAEVEARRRRRLRPREDAEAPGAAIGASRAASAVEETGARSGRGRAKRERPPETEGPTRGDLPTRIVTGLAIAVVALICLKIGRGPTAVLAAAIVGIAAFELFEGLRKNGFHPATVIGVLGSVTLVLAAYKRGEAAFPLVGGLVLVFTFLWYLIEVVKARATVNIAVTLLGFAYVGGLGGFAGLLLTYQHGVGLVLGLAICVVGYDVFGYLIGSRLGKTPLAPQISPNKTLEGLLGGMVGSIVLGVFVARQITPWKDTGHALALGVLVAVMAPLGDLCESMLKRDLSLKDFGSILPGHGGLLDRFDGLLFCLPAVYYLARYLF